MVSDEYWTYWDDHSVNYVSVSELRCTPESNIMLCGNYEVNFKKPDVR